MNTCGYKDLNFNGIADGAPREKNHTPEPEHTTYRICEHNVIEGTWVCNHPDCIAVRESLKGGVLE